MVFGYDTDVTPSLGTNLIRIKDLDRDLLGSLGNKRQTEEVSGFCSGLGGFVDFILSSILHRRKPAY